MPTTSAAHDPTTPIEAARKGYEEMVRLVTRHRAKPDGICLGERTDLLLGLSLDDASPIFFDPFGMSPRILGIVGDAGAGKTFTARLIQLRARWTCPRDVVEVADDNDQEDPTRAFRYPFPPKRGEPRRAVITTGRDSTRLGRCFAGGKAPAEWGFRGLLLRTTPTPDMEQTLSKAEVEWLPKARLPKEAGYAEGLLWTTRAHYPLAVVASTPEFEYPDGAGSPVSCRAPKR